MPKLLRFVALLGAGCAFAQIRPPMLPPPGPGLLDKYEQILRIRMQQQEIEGQRLQNVIEAKRLREAEAQRSEAAEEKSTASPAESAPATPRLGGTNTYGFLNGRLWQRLPPLVKLAYVLGSTEAFVSAAGVGEDISQFTAQNLAQDEISAALDRFFSQPENLLIRIVDALRFVSLRASGATQAKLDEEIALARSMANAAPERKNGE